MTFPDFQRPELFYKTVPESLYTGNMDTILPMVSSCVTNLGHFTTLMFQVCTFYDGCKQGIDQHIFNRKSISRKITHPQSYKLQAKLTGEN